MKIQKTTARVVKPRISRSKGQMSKRTAFVRDIVKEVAGLAPYERRVVELLRNSKDKRARKLAKKRVSLLCHPDSQPDHPLGVGAAYMTLLLTCATLRQLGTFGRAKRKVDELQRVIAESRRTAAH